MENLGLPHLVKRVESCKVSHLKLTAQNVQGKETCTVSTHMHVKNTLLFIKQ